MSTSVKFLHSGMVGAPQWTFEGAGVGIAVLDACLVNGFNTQTATSVVVSGGIATATIPLGQGYEADTVVLVAGATPSELNGEKRVLSSSTTTVTFASTSPDGTATGTITLKYAPLGWLKPFSAASQAAYRSADPASTQFWLSIASDGAGNSNHVVYGYENMTAVATGTNPFPTGAQQDARWIKSPSGAAPWAIIGDGKTFYVLRQHVNGGNFASGTIMGFGDFESFKAVDPYRCFMAAFNGSSGMTNTAAAGSTAASAAIEVLSPSATGSATLFAARSMSGVLLPQSLAKSLESYQATTTNYTASGGLQAPGGSAFSTYPNAADSSLILSRIALSDNGSLRGRLRGVLATPQNAHASFSQFDRVTGQGAYSGQKLIAFKCGSPGGITSQGVVFFNLTGAWE